MICKGIRDISPKMHFRPGAVRAAMGKETRGRHAAPGSGECSVFCGCGQETVTAAALSFVASVPTVSFT